MPISTTKANSRVLTPSISSMSTKQTQPSLLPLSHARVLPPTWCTSFQSLLALTRARAGSSLDAQRSSKDGLNKSIRGDERVASHGEFLVSSEYYYLSTKHYSE